MTTASLRWINNLRLPTREGLWQIEIVEGKIARITAQPQQLSAEGAALDAEGGLAYAPFIEPHIHWIPPKRRVNRPGISPARCLKVLSAGQSGKPY